MLSSYFSQYSENNIYLLYYENHYDLFENNHNPLSEYEDDKEEEEFYQSSNASFIPGTCLECDKTTDVNEENGLCQGCIDKSMAGLDTFKKDKMGPGLCSQCNR